VDMLIPPAKELLLRLGAFRGPFALDAVEWLSADLPETGVDLLEALIDGSLISQRDHTALPSYDMLATLREYACEQLVSAGQLDAVQRSHAEFYVDLARRAEPELISAGQSAWVSRLRDEYDNLRATVEYLLRTGQADTVIQIVWPLYWFWWVSGRGVEATSWVDALHDAHDISERGRHIAEFYRTVGAIWIEPEPAGIPELLALLDYFVAQHDTLAEVFIRNSIALLHLQQPVPEPDEADEQLRSAQRTAEERHSPFMVAMTLLLRGQVAIACGDLTSAVHRYESALRAATESGDVYSRSAALSGLAWVHIFRGNAADGKNLLRQFLEICRSTNHEEGLALGLEGMFAVAALNGDIPKAGRFLGAAENVRARRGITGPTVFSNHQSILASLEDGPAADALLSARLDGREAQIDAVLEEALH
jgi:hypothetical protein